MTMWKWIVYGLIAGAVGAYLNSCNAEPMQFYNFQTAPNNFDNSTSNFDNSPSNFNNSPMNWANSPQNISATNGIYDDKGNRVGYTTITPKGVINIFSNDGDRLGYVPAPYAPVRIGK